MKLVSTNPYTEQMMGEFETLSFEESAQMLQGSRQASILYLARVNFGRSASIFWPKWR